MLFSQYFSLTFHPNLFMCSRYKVLELNGKVTNGSVQLLIGNIENALMGYSTINVYSLYMIIYIRDLQ